MRRRGCGEGGHFLQEAVSTAPCPPLVLGGRVSPRDAWGESGGGNQERERGKDCQSQLSEWAKPAGPLLVPGAH